MEEKTFDSTNNVEEEKGSTNTENNLSEKDAYVEALRQVEAEKEAKEKAAKKKKRKGCAIGCGVVLLIPILIILGFGLYGKINSNQINFENAYYDVENGNYDSAAKYLSKVDDDYGNKKEAEAWLHIKMARKKAIASAESDLKGNLKNPSSYSQLSVSSTYSCTRFDGNTADYDMFIKLKYTATNSFGGTVTETYTCTKTVTSIDVEGINSEDDANEIIYMTNKEFASRMKESVAE